MRPHRRFALLRSKHFDPTVATRGQPVKCLDASGNGTERLRCDSREGLRTVGRQGPRPLGRIRSALADLWRQDASGVSGLHAASGRLLRPLWLDRRSKQD